MGGGGAITFNVECVVKIRTNISTEREYLTRIDIHRAFCRFSNISSIADRYHAVTRFPLKSAVSRCKISVSRANEVEIRLLKFLRDGTNPADSRHRRLWPCPSHIRRSIFPRICQSVRARRVAITSNKSFAVSSHGSPIVSPTFFTSVLRRPRRRHVDRLHYPPGRLLKNVSPLQRRLTAHAFSAFSARTILAEM